MEFFSNSPAPAGSNTSWERPRNNDIVVIDAAFADGLLEEMAPIDELAFDGMEMATVNDDTSTAARTTHDLHSADSSDGGYICFCPHCGNTENVRELQTGHICIGCGEILVSALNSAGISFSIGDDIFFVAKCELPFAGSIIRFPDEKSAVVRYKDSSWCFSAYDETKNIDDISTALEDLLSKNQRRGRNRRVQRFADIQLVLRDGEKEPCPKCKAMVSAKTNTCYKCNYKIRTRALPCGSHLFTGQDLFFRNKLGDMTAGVLEKILDNDMVEIRYKDPHWSLSKYNEVHPLESVASTMDNLLRHVGSRKRVAPKDFVEMSIEHERTLQVARIERTRELSIIKEREAARVAEILRKEKEREEHTREKEAARAKLQLQRQKEREKAREKRHEIKLKERERLKKMDHYERNRFKRLAKAAKARKEKKNGRDLQLIGTVVIVDNILLPGGRKITRDALNEHENRTKIAKKQAAMLAEARPCTLQLCPWVTDYVCANIQSPENEHNTFCFRPRERGKTINVSVRQMSISEVLRRVRFVEACSATIHCGLSRLDRWEQRALCHYIYKNTLPHRLSKRNGGGADAVAYAAPNISSMKVHSPYNKKGASKSRIFKQLETNLKQFISSPDNSTPSKRRVTSTSSCISTPFGGRYRHHLADVDCSFLTVGLLERVLWACPTNEREFYILVQSYELLRSPLVPALIELVNDFLELKQLTPRGHFNEVVQLNKDINALKILSTNDNDMNPVDEESTKTPKYHNLPLHCALCPQLAQSEQDRLRPIYTQDEFTKLQATFPLTVSEFIFALNVAYERCGGRARLEGCTPAQYTIDGSEGAHRTMYGRVNENLVQEIVERTTMSSRDVFSDLGCGVGQTCLQVSATTGCRSLGYEIVSERCEAALMLLREFDAVLSEAGVVPAGTMTGLVSLLEEDFIKDIRVARDSTVVLFNNFSKWFDADIPGKGTNYNSEICTQFLRLQTNAHVFTLSELIAAKIWLPRRVFMAPINSTSWQVSEDKRVPIHHYIKDSEFWRCRVCRVCTPNHLTEECLNGHVPRIVRALDGDESCSSYDEESFASSSSDSSDYDSDLSGSDNGQCTDSMSPAKLSPTKKKQMTQDELEEKLKKLPKVSVSVTQITFSSIKELVEYRRKKCNELKKLRTLGYGIGIFSETDQAHVRVHHRLKGKEADEERLEYLRRCNKRLPNTTGKFIASCDKVNTQKNNRIKKTGITAGEKIPVPAFLNTKDSDDLEAESFISSSSESESDFTSSDSYYA